MNHKPAPTEKQLRKLERMLADDRKEATEIEQEIRLLEEKLLEKRPSHFSARDVINAFFAASIIGFTIILKGEIINVASALSVYHIWAIIIVTCATLYAEIYYVGYTRVRPEEHRRLGQFVAKRFFAFYGVALLVSFSLTYLFGIDQFMPTFHDTLKLVVMVSLPCAAGAAIPTLLKQF